MLRVKEFPYGGEQYFEILSKCYLTKWRYSESDMLGILNMERSRFYDRKKEAIYVFGLSLWGGAIPQLKTFLQENPLDEYPDEDFSIAFAESDQSPTFVR